jgi:hypothetical protein
VRLGPLKWSTKRYVAGRSITSGWLAVFMFVGFISFGLFRVLSPNGLLPYQLDPVWALILVGIGVGWTYAMQVWRCGFAALPYTRKGLEKDIHGRLFLGQLGGEGSVCPVCHAKLRFENANAPPNLRCTRSRDHRWAFDFTAVKD